MPLSSETFFQTGFTGIIALVALLLLILSKEAFPRRAFAVEINRLELAKEVSGKLDFGVK